MDLKLSLMEGSGLPVDQLIQARIGSPNLQVEAIRQGIGVGLFNARIARQDIEAGHVVELPLPHPVDAVYYAVVPRGPRHPLVDAFTKWLVSII